MSEQKYSYLTPIEMVAKYSFMSIGGLRGYILHEKENGLADSGAISRMGRKILINEDKFFAWVESNSKVQS